MLPASIEAYLAAQPRMYTEEQHGEAIRRVATEITRRAHSRYSALLARSVMAAMLTGMLVGWALGGLL